MVNQVYDENEDDVDIEVNNGSEGVKENKSSSN